MRDAAEFEPYVRAIFDRLGLKDWEARVLDDPPPSDSAYAYVECVYGRKLAHVQFSRNFLRGSEAEQRHAVVHEALHCHFTQADQVHAKLAGDEHYGIFKLAMEYGIDAVAVAIAPLFPLPSEVLAPDCMASTY